MTAERIAPPLCSSRIDQPIASICHCTRQLQSLVGCDELIVCIAPAIRRCFAMDVRPFLVDNTLKDPWILPSGARRATKQAG